MQTPQSDQSTYRNGPDVPLLQASLSSTSTSVPENAWSLVHLPPLHISLEGDRYVGDPCDNV